jgi:hypothetical protein
MNFSVPNLAFDDAPSPAGEEKSASAASPDGIGFVFPPSAFQFSL